MKKMFCMMLTIASLVGFTSCSGDDKEDGTLNLPSSKSMKVGDVYDMQYKSNWASNNTFVASVDNNGVVTANRVGTANIYSNAHRCQINVSANITLYQEPITDWGITKSNLINRKGNADATSASSVAYYLDSEIAPMEMYSFEDNKLTAAVVLVSTNYTEYMINHLSERFKPVYVDSEDLTALFINAESLDEAKTTIVTTLYNTKYWAVMYMLNDGSSKARSTQADKIKELKLELDKMKL
jgi:hypothetical protein